MLCGKCGNVINEGQKFCEKCGAPAEVAGQNQVQQTEQQPMYQQQPVYGNQYQPVYGQSRNPNDGRGFSIAALVVGICATVFCWITTLNVIVLAVGILGIIFGLIGRKKSIAAYGKASGLATAGFVLGIIGTSICGLGVLSCTVCPAVIACNTYEAVDSMFYGW